MTESCSLICSLPICRANHGEQTRLSIGVRITVTALGIIALLVSILIISGVQGLSQCSAAAGWTIFSTALASIALAALFKGVKQNHFIEYYEFKEIDPHALNAVTSQDVYSVLSDCMKRADQIWPLAIYHMMLESHLDEEGCHPILQIGNFFVQDAECIDTLYTSDWFSTAHAPCYPVTLKRAIDELSEEQRVNLVNALKGLPYTDSKVIKVMNLINELATHLQERYSFALSQEAPSMPQIIFNHLKEVIRELQIENEDDLSDYEVLKKISALLSIKILLQANLSEEENCLNFGPLALEFSMIHRDSFDPKIPNFSVNALTSFDNDDEPVCHTHPLELAILLNGMDETQKAHLMIAIKESQTLDREIALSLIPMRNLLLKRYVMPFMQIYKETSTSVAIKVPIKQKELSYSLATNKTRESNLGQYELETTLEIFFILKKTYFKPAGRNCVLAAVLLAIDPKIDYYKHQVAGNQKIKEIRNAMADYLEEHEANFIGYFENKNIFTKHVKKLRNIDKLLEAIDFEILAQVINHPLCIYDKNAPFFYVNEKSEPIPYIFGRECSLEPIFLLDSSAHYDLLIKK